MEIAEVSIQIVHDQLSSRERSGARWSAKVGDRHLRPDSDLTLYSAEEAFAAALDAVDRHLAMRQAAAVRSLIEFRCACATSEASAVDDDDIEGVPT